ncbi:sortase A [Enterococcus sp. AZ071]
MAKQEKTKPKKKISGLMVFAIIMIVSGVLVLLYPIVGNILANRERSSASSSYNEELKHLTVEEREQQYQLAQQYNQYIFQKQQGNEVPKIDYQQVIKQSSKVMGTIDIPAISIKQMPFYHGTSYKTLDKGLGHYEESSIPIGGENTRSVITGHSGVKNQVLFSDIKSLEKGDIFYINILGKKLAYKIDSFEEILPNEVEKVHINPGKDQVTLLTCTPPGINTYRLLVTGHRIPYQKALKQQVKKRNLWSYQNIVLFALLFNFLLFLLLLLLYRHYLKQFRSIDPEKMDKGRKRLKRLFLITKSYFIIIFLFMLTILGIATYGYLTMQEDTAVAPIEIGETESLSNYNLDKIQRANYEERQIASVNVSDYAKAKSMLMESTNNWGVGKLAIPQVSIDLPILAGLTNENLLTGAATYRSDQQLGKDNYVLLAHNIYDQDVLLHRIKQLNDGDLIYATDFQDVYTYKVVRNEVIEDTEVGVVEKQVNGRPLITLLRCEGNIGTPYREVVQGELVTQESVNEAPKERLKELGLQKKKGASPQKLVKKQPIPPFQQFAMMIAGKFVSEPLQTMVPMFIFLVLPILFFALIR